MANNELSAIRSALSTKLTELVSATLKQVVIGRISAATGFPYCRFYLVRVSHELMDNTPSNMRTYEFAVEVRQEMTAKDIATAEANFEDAIDAVMDKLGSNWTLTNNVDVSILTSGTIDVIESPQGPALSATILVSCQTLIS